MISILERQREEELGHLASFLRKKKQTKSKKGRRENEHSPFGVHY